MRVALLALLLAHLLVFGCSEKRDEAVTGVCVARVNCPNERAPAKVDECNDAAFDEACGAAYRAYFSCFQSNQICDGRGLLDQDASASRCRELADAYGRCVTPGVTDTGEALDTAIEDTGTVEDTATEDTATEDVPAD